MPDREKIIKGLERCLICNTSVIASAEEEKAYRDCEYTVGLYCGRDKLLRDAIAVLKEQEPIRCKDCAYALFKEGAVEHGHIICTKPYTERWQVAKPDNWFCADGIQKNV